MKKGERSPRIIRCSWGCMEIEGRERALKDAKLFPGGSREWDWGETGTSHDPGIQTADVLELIERGATAIVLSNGFYGRLGVCPDALRFLEEKGIRVDVLKTNEAVERYNDLREREPVGGLFHSTC